MVQQMSTATVAVLASIRDELLREAATSLAWADQYAHDKKG
jgi:hypothetical protein